MSTTVTRGGDLAIAGPGAWAEASARPHVLVAVNGPGEVAAWLYPFVCALRERSPQAIVTVVLLPCVFASGREEAVINAMHLVNQVIAPGESLAWTLRGRAPRLISSPDLVLHLGGELLLSVLLARRLGVPVAAYCEDDVRWGSLIDQVFVRDAAVDAGRARGRVQMVGNLMVDAARRRVRGGRALRSRDLTVALLPGSRPYFVRHMLPLLLRAADRIRMVHPEARFVLAKSDFISHDDLTAALEQRADALVAGDGGTLQRCSGAWTVQSERGVIVEVVAPDEALRRARVAVTIPGTNTAELAALGIPMLVVLPTYRLHALPMPGLVGHLGGIPLLGPLLKQLAALAYLRVRNHWAHPNRLAREMVVPELIGRISADDIAERLCRMLHEGLEKTEDRLRLLMGAPGAADRLADAVLALVANRR